MDSTWTTKEIEELINLAIKKERKRLADKVKNIQIGEHWLIKEIAKAIESE